MRSSVSLRVQDEIAVLLIDNPPVNAMGASVRSGIIHGLSAASSDEKVMAIVLRCGGKTFIAGADINEFGKPAIGPTGADVILAIEQSSKPVIAAMHGTALGGGLELALGCNFRVAVRGTRFGLPEVKLGLLPGGGGTQRLPRLIGPERALDLMLTGDTIQTDEALETGLIDAVLEGDLEAGAIEFARSVVATARGTRRVRDMSERTRGVAAESLVARMGGLAKAQQGSPAPELIVQCVVAAINKPFDEGLAFERAAFVELRDSPQSAAQRYCFLAEREAMKVRGLPEGIQPRQIRTVGVIGAGTMGGGIAMNFLNKRTPVVLVEAEQAALDRGLKNIRRNYERSARKGKLEQADVEERLALITPSLDIAALADCDLVIEAVFEDMTLKKRVFGALDQVAREGAILATNTSFLDVNDIAGCLRRPDDVIGMHFFSPANVMRLLEVVRGRATSDEVLATTVALAKSIGKVPVVVGVCHGFVGNRMYSAMRDQALSLIQEGAMPWDVDRVLEEFGMPMGPFAMADLAGLDIGWSAETSQPGNFLRHRLCELGRRGQKAGAGYYTYDPETRARSVDGLIGDLVNEYAIRSAREQRQVSDTEILERCLYTLVNQGAMILHEGIAQRASDIDVIWVNGYGWPAYRGGPMYWADQTGLPAIVEALRAHEPRLGFGWEMAPNLVQLAEEGVRFVQ